MRSERVGCENEIELAIARVMGTEVYFMWITTGLIKEGTCQILLVYQCMFGTKTHFGLKTTFSVGKQAFVVLGWGWGMGGSIQSCVDYRQLLIGGLG